MSSISSEDMRSLAKNLSGPLIDEISCKKSKRSTNCISDVCVATNTSSSRAWDCRSSSWWRSCDKMKRSVGQLAVNDNDDTHNDNKCAMRMTISTIMRMMMITYVQYAMTIIYNDMHNDSNDVIGSWGW
jgi:hypothetical protein